jgi:hypothetical protein
LGMIVAGGERRWQREARRIGNGERERSLAWMACVSACAAGVERADKVEWMGCVDCSLG